MKRRDLLNGIASGGVLVGLAHPTARAETAAVRPWDWVTKAGEATDTDGTPLQFMPKSPADPEPLSDELAKYPRCPYCGMARGHEKWRRTRHLIHYAGALVDATCSIHCAALSLGLNMDLGPDVIYAADAGAAVPPLIEVAALHYVISPQGTPGTMTGRRKWAYADLETANAAVAEFGGQVGSFDDALRAAYADMAEDTIMIRRRRAERRRRAAQ